MSGKVLLTFRLGPERYGIDIVHVTRVLPALDLKALPQAPPYVVGLGNLHGTSLPVIDLCLLALGRPCRTAMSTRIIQVSYDHPGGLVRFGLLAEAVNEVIRVDPANLNPSGVHLPDTRYLGPVVSVDGHLLQQVEIDQLLPDHVLALLMQANEV